VQSVVVYQMASGKQILRVECSPIEPAGQNFALSPDGLHLALIRDNSIEIYNLPELTGKEDADVKLAEAAAPEDTGLPVHFLAEEQTLAGSGSAADTQSDTVGSSDAVDSLTQPAVAASASATPAPESNATAPSASTAEGDPSPNQPRKPPTLYTLPTDPPRSAPNNPDNQPQ
jgi:hypothetical protein